MTIEIKKPELELLIQQQLQSGAFHDVDELLAKALSALLKPSPACPEPQPSIDHPKKNFAQFLMDSPLAGSELNLEREKDYPRPVDL